MSKKIAKSVEKKKKEDKKRGKSKSCENIGLKYSQDIRPFMKEPDYPKKINEDKVNNSLGVNAKKATLTVESSEANPLLGQGLTKENDVIVSADYIGLQSRSSSREVIKHQTEESNKINKGLEVASTDIIDNNSQRVFDLADKEALTMEVGNGQTIETHSNEGASGQVIYKKAVEQQQTNNLQQSEDQGANPKP